MLATQATESAPLAPPVADLAADLHRAAEAVFRETGRQIREQRFPGATYRLQFNSQFTFRDAADLVPYLHALGITHVYASPLLQARPGSLHGYDVVNHAVLNPDLGTPADFDRYLATLREHGLEQILDVVPNHMCVASEANVWWQDVLENGPSSPFAAYFDIDWMPLKPDLANKVLLPVLGDQFGKVLEDGQLRLTFADGAFWLHYYERRFPLAPQSFSRVLAHRLDELRQQLGSEHPGVQELLSILTAIKNLPPWTETDPVKVEELRREKEVVKRRLRDLAASAAEVTAFLDENLRQFNGQRGDPRSFDRLDELLQQQPYRLAFWRVAADEINYRRFFDINELAAICMEQPAVFEDAHRLTFEWLRSGAVTGLRIDHPDGLYDPPGYLRQLQSRRFLQIARQVWEAMQSRNPARFGDVTWEQLEPRLRELQQQAATIANVPEARPMYVVVEKILEPGEELPEDWPTHGTVGYEFLNAVNNVFVDAGQERPCTQLYTRFTNETRDFRQLQYESKRLITRLSMSSELEVLGYQLDRISERNRWSRDFTLNSLTRALREVIGSFSVYRTYIADGHLLDRDRGYVELAVARAKRRNPAMSSEVFDFVRDILLLRYRENADDSEREAQRRFVGKFQQMTGPIMAKAIEDTALYVFNRLVSLNEVGGAPETFGIGVDEFHRQNQRRLTRSPWSLSATTTHDTKRSEDVRARINVLSEIPGPWRKQVMRWSRLNRRLKSDVDGELAPIANDEFLLYQTLLGIWPVPRSTGVPADVAARIQQYMLKAAREAKVHTSWVTPHAGYEQALERFIAGLFASRPRQPFVAEFDRFAAAVTEHGIWNSLGQTLVKIASPGVPDFYQGTELWTHTLVDPDNRQPVDYVPRRRGLNELRFASRAELLPELLARRHDGRIKQFVTWAALQARREFEELFSVGAYEPLEVRGSQAHHVIAFARRYRQQIAITVVPRLTVGLVGLGGPPPLGDVWSDTVVALPADAGSSFHNVFTGEAVSFPPTGVELRDGLAAWPLGLWIAR